MVLPFYDYRRWIIIVLISFLFILKLIITIDSLTDIGKEKQETFEIVKKIFFELLGCGILLLGLVGAIKENFFLSLSFCLLLVYLVIKDSIEHNNHWHLIAGLGVLLLIDISFVYDLYGKQSAARSINVSNRTRKS